MIVVDVKKPMGDRVNELTHMAYYMEKDVRWSSVSIMRVFYIRFKEKPVD